MASLSLKNEYAWFVFFLTNVERKLSEHEIIHVQVVGRRIKRFQTSQHFHELNSQHPPHFVRLADQELHSLNRPFERFFAHISQVRLFRQIHVNLLARKHVFR